MAPHIWTVPRGCDDSVSDDADLARAAPTEPAAFETLYRRYRDRVYRYLRARTATEEDAVDLTQQVFLRVLDALPHYQAARGLFAAWLFRIARNAATDFQRRRRATVAWDLVPEALQRASGDTVEDAVLRREDFARLATLFTALDAEKREIVVLRFVARLTLAEIAAVIGKSEDATRMSLTRTLRRLKEQYHDTAP